MPPAATDAHVLALPYTHGADHIKSLSARAIQAAHRAEIERQLEEAKAELAAANEETARAMADCEVASAARDALRSLGCGGSASLALQLVRTAEKMGRLSRDKRLAADADPAAIDEYVEFMDMIHAAVSLLEPMAAEEAQLL